jgi:hypothetical protein
MISKIIAKFSAWLLRHKDLSVESKNIIASAMIENLHALPIRSIISFDEQGTVLINGEQLDIERAKLLRESASAGVRSTARKLIRDQLLYEALKKGVGEGFTPDQILFSKAIIWWYEQEDYLYRQLSGPEE